ncbi:MAG: NTP transferase domain-containing protein, partial [Candidatus Heimdallarchaeota archaeon]|nr:NTP transferase domain-containing protein [Candidatus Heimdallarchaeota archaeon]MCK5049082.1 NTP transferase domain-containing protein [Candidatus Heimdallarchaeota archaeon]
GIGKRLKPLTDNVPKPLLKIAGKSPLERSIDALLAIGVSDIGIIVDFQSELIEEEIGLKYPDIEFIPQGEPKGTGHAVKRASEFIKESPFFVIYGDLLFDTEIINKMHKLALEEKEKAFISGFEGENITNFGALFHNDQMELTAIIEKPQEEVDNALINAGIYLFPSTIWQFIDNLTPSPRGELELTDAIEGFIQEQVAQCVKIDQYWFDVGRPWALLEANKKIMSIEAEDYQISEDAIIEDGAHLLGKVQIGAGTRIRSGAYIEGPVYIGANCDIGPNCYIRSFSFFDEEVKVGNACEIKNTILYKGTHAAHLSYVGDSIIGRKCNLGAGTITANLRHDNGNIWVNISGKKENTGLRKLGVIMGDRVKTSTNTQIMPGIKIKSGKHIYPSEALVTKDMD